MPRTISRVHSSQLALCSPHLCLAILSYPSVAIHSLIPLCRDSCMAHSLTTHSLPCTQAVTTAAVTLTLLAPSALPTSPATTPASSSAAAEPSNSITASFASSATDASLCPAAAP